MAVAGKLAAIMTLDGEPYLKALKVAKEQSIGFAKDLGNLPNLAGKGMSGVAGIVTGSVGAIKGSLTSLTTGIGAIAGMFPGGAAIAGTIAHPFEAGERAMERTKELAHQARRLGVDPQFLRAFQFNAGPDAELATKSLEKLLRLQGEVKAGSTDLMEAGRSSASKMLEKWGLNPGELAKMTGAEFIKAIVEQGSKIEDPALRMAYAIDLAKKGGVGLIEVLEKGPEALAATERRMQSLGLYTKEQIAMTRAWAAARKELGLLTEAYEQNAMPMAASMGIGWTRLKAGQLGGIPDMGLGIAGWLNKVLPGTTDPKNFLPDSVKNILNAQGAEDEEFENPFQPGKKFKLHKEKGFVLPEGQSTKDFDAIQKTTEQWERLNAIMGMSTEQIALYDAKQAHWSEQQIADLTKQTDLHARLVRSEKELHEAMQESMAIFDEESSRMEKWAEAKRERQKNPLDKIMELDPDQIYGQFQQLENSLGKSGAGNGPRLAPLAEGLSSASVSAINAYGQTGGAGNIADRVEAVRKELERRGAEAKRMGDQIIAAIGEIQQPPVADF